MVRLKGKREAMRQKDFDEFQFQYGSIKSSCS